jgi:hypothetical protein
MYGNVRTSDVSRKNDSTSVVHLSNSNLENLLSVTNESVLCTFFVIVCQSFCLLNKEATLC